MKIQKFQVTVVAVAAIASAIVRVTITVTAEKQEEGHGSEKDGTKEVPGKGYGVTPFNDESSATPIPSV
ncbi:MAG: hypothetical protein H0X50_03355 [Nitrosopumilus sp.]|nr:hypothetical protein [Nitrosopumilus sp.]